MLASGESLTGSGCNHMDALGITHLVIGLGIVGGAMVGFNKLVGKGPRGTLWIIAACLFTWASMMPSVLRCTKAITRSL